MPGGLKLGNVNLTFANDTGTLTATAFVGDGSGLTGIGATAATALTFDVKAGTSALKKGQAVYISGAAGSNPIVSAADNTVTVKSRVVGLMIADTSANAQRKVRRAGTLTAVEYPTSNTNINPNGETWSTGNIAVCNERGRTDQCSSDIRAFCKSGIFSGKMKKRGYPSLFILWRIPSGLPQHLGKMWYYG